MPAVVRKNMNGTNELISALRELQTYLSRPLIAYGDAQSIGPEIIKLQTFLSTQNAAGQPSGKKFDPAKIARFIDDQQLSGKLTDLQIAADLT